jgi:hypothetical protein
MLQQKLLIDVLSVLKANNIEYMITGSVASSVQGEPRTTHDIDIIVNIQRDAVSSLLNAFSPPQYYLNEQAILDAIDQQSMFNLIDVNEGNKIDFWMLTKTPFDESRFKRKYAQLLFGVTMFVSSPEDTILMKLKWAQESGGSEKQFVDALRVFELQNKLLDFDYLETWSEKLQLNASWNELKRKANPLP